MDEKLNDQTKKVKSSYDKKVHGKRYTLTQKLAVRALLKAGKTPTEIEREEKIDRSTVYEMMKDHRIAILPDKIVQDIKRSLIGYQYGNAFRSQLKITDSKLDEMNAYQLSLISSINIDKARLMSNESTANVLHGNVINSLEGDRESLMKRMNDLLG